ncbi:MAG: sulfurtransferase [Candidatus Eremiobacteraeota bacterium]|nr:sulfurtransferase [Candidatus Eremiobacteraeota bacterium]
MFRTIVSAKQVHDHLDDPSFVVVDCRHALADFTLGRRQYDEGHIPGAFFAGVEEDLSGAKTGTNGRHPMPEAETFARFLRAIGVSDSTQIVAYDAGGDMFAPRLWFLARWIGHDAVAVLDGGFGSWQRHKYPISAAPAQDVAEGTLTVRLRPEYLVDARYVHERLENRGAMQLVDGRASDRFAGQNEFVDPIAGHIPGALNRWFKDSFNEDGTLKTPEELRAEFERRGLDPSRVVHQCGSGISAAANHFAMEHAGLEGSRIYGGSWSEWIADPSRPITTGAE